MYPSGQRRFFKPNVVCLSARGVVVAHASPKGKDGGSNPSGHHVYGLTLNETNNPRYHTAIKNPRTFNLFFGPYGIGVSRPILRERATFGTLNQMVSESGKPPIPHGLVVRIRAFHARGRGSIPRGGDLRQHTAIPNPF